MRPFRLTERETPLPFFSLVSARLMDTRNVEALLRQEETYYVSATNSVARHLAEMETLDEQEKTARHNAMLLIIEEADTHYHSVSATLYSDLYAMSHTWNPLKRGEMKQQYAHIKASHERIREMLDRLHYYVLHRVRREDHE